MPETRGVRHLWRISNHADLAGLGGEKADGRWHTAAPGKRIVYLAEHPAVALLETLVHLKGNPALFPESYQLLRVDLDPDFYARIPLLANEQGTALTGDAALSACRKAGDRWLQSLSSALVWVPSIPSPHSMNALLNPLHPEASLLRVGQCVRIRYDKRLFRAETLH